MPPTPSPTVPPGPEVKWPIPSVSALPYLDPPPDPKGKHSATKNRPSPTIHLGEKHETDEPYWAGAGLITKGGFKVKVKGGTLTAVETGAADSHCLFGVRSETVATLQLVQEFTIVPASEEENLAQLSLSGKLDGYLRSEKHASASLRVVEAVV
jgi:hypothetical protein